MEDPYNGFNPRTRTGCDIARARQDMKEAVSTHAPARGATEWITPTPPGVDVSTHAPARGATVGLVP